MHILIIAPEQLPVPSSGSVEICILSIAKQLAKQHKVTIVSRKSPGLKPLSTMGNITIVRLAARSPLTYISSILRFIKGKSYDVVQVDNRPHYLAAIKQNFPNTRASLFLHSLTFAPRTRKVSTSINKADLIIANSTSLSNKLSRRFPRQQHKISTVYLGVDTARFRPASQEERSSIRAEYKLRSSFVILFTGRVVPRKGVSVLVQAASIVRKKVKGAKLVVVGKGRSAYISKLKKQTVKKNVPAMFIGEIPHEKIHRLYQMADCFVCPSQRHEAFGLVNVEALGTGLPVVASSIGGIKEIINHGSNGYLVANYRNPARFAHYITAIARDKKHSEEIARKGRSTAIQRFSWSQTARKLSNIYSQV